MVAALIAVAVVLVLAARVFAARLGRRDEAPEPPARPDQIAGLAQALLGRDPQPGDPLPEPDDATTLPEAAAALAASAVHREAVAAGGAGVLAGTPVAEAALPPGTASPDGVAVVGTRGRLYIAHGANDFARQFRGETPLSPEGVAGWAALAARTDAAAAQLGVQLVRLIVPDKLAIEPDGFPEPLDDQARRPVHQLLDACPGAFVYPLRELRRAAAHEPVSLRTDSHVTAAGARVLHGEVLRALGLARRARHEVRVPRAYLLSGDLGTKFTPRIHEVTEGPQAEPGLTLVEDNAPQILALGGHLGVRRVVRNEAPEVDARLVVFGDSYAYIEPAGPGNLGELLARTFREVHFLWAPFCWDAGYLERHRPDVVLLQMAERFAITVPREAVDVEALAVETLRRKGGVVPEEITDPAVAPAAPAPEPSA